MVGSETAPEVPNWLLNWAPEVRKAILVAVPEEQGEVLNGAAEVRTMLVVVLRDQKKVMI
jgi:hypothetical protein